MPARRRKKDPSKPARKKPVPKPGLHRPRCGGKWTEAQFRQFIVNQLRGARWPEKFECIKAAFVGEGINPATGHKCKLHRCPECDGLFPQNGMHADHDEPVVGPEGFTTWDDYINRLFVERDGFSATCKACHAKKTEEERQERQRRKLLAMSSKVDFDPLGPVHTEEMGFLFDRT